MINLIIEEYNKWIKNPREYINTEIYNHDYDPYFPPMQVIGNLYNEEDLIDIKTKVVSKNNLFHFEGTDSLKIKNKIAVIGLEPLASNPMNPNGSYQKQFKALYPSPHQNPLVNNEKKINRFREDIDFNKYLEWQLNYFNFWRSNFHSEVQLSRHWHKCWNLAKGVLNGENDFVPDTYNANHYMNYQTQGLDWISKTIIAIDILPMHSSNNNTGMIDHGLDLFERKISLMKPHVGLMIGKSAFNTLRKKFRSEPQDSLHVNNLEVENCKLFVGSHEMKLFCMPSRGNGTYRDYYHLGSKLSNIIDGD